MSLPSSCASVPLILSTQTGLVSPQFHCVFDDHFETVKNEPNNTSLWQHKAHFTKLAFDKTNDLFISTPTHTQAPTPCLFPYASEIPAALLQLPDPPVPQTNNEPGQADNPESPVAPPATSDLPQAVPPDPMPPTAPSPTYPINIAPTDRHNAHRTSSPNSIPFRLCGVPGKNCTFWYCQPPSSCLPPNGQWRYPSTGRLPRRNAPGSCASSTRP